MLSQKSKNLLSFGVLSFLIMWQLAIATMIAIPLFTGGFFAFPNTQGQTGITDFVRVYASGKIAQSEMRQRAYEPLLQRSVIDEVLKPQAVGNDFFINYVPFVFLVSAPLALLPLTFAYLIWTSASLFAGMSGLAAVLRSRQATKRQILVCCLCVSASLPAVIAVRTGQTTWFLLCLWSFFYLALTNGRYRLAGFLLALSAFKPQYTPFFLIALFVQKRYLTLLYFGLSLSGLMILAGLVVGYGNVFAYPGIVMAAEAVDNVEIAPYSASVRAIFSCFLAGRAALYANLATMLAALGGVFWMWLRCNPKAIGIPEAKTSEAIAWAMSLTIVIGLFFGAHTGTYDCTLLALPAALTWPLSWQDKKSTAMKVWFFTLICYLIVPWILCGIPGVYHRYYLVMDVVLLVAGFKLFISASSPAIETVMAPTSTTAMSQEEPAT